MNIYEHRYFTFVVVTEHKSNCENVTILLENFKNVNHREKI